MKSTRFLAGSAVVLLISALIIFSGSATAPIRADEAAYALLADHLRRGGDWLYLEHWSVAGRHYFDKPPLYFWLSAATESLIGFQPLSFRMWSGLFACGAVLCTIVVGRNLYDGATGLIAGLLLAVNSSFLFSLGARDGVLNTAIVFFVAAALATTTGDWPQRRPRLAWLCLTLAGAAAGWTKPLNGLIVLAVAGAAAACFASGERRPRLKIIALAAGPVVAANLLWPLLQWIHFGDVFLARFVGWNLLQRFESGINATHVHPWHYYPTVIHPAMALGWLAAGWRFVRRRRAADAIVCLVPLIYLAAISLTPSKLVHYAFPGFPLLAVAAAALIWQIASWLAPSWRPAALGAAVIALGALGLYKVSRDLASYPPQNWERPGCPASAEPGRAVEVLLVGVSALDQVTAETRSSQLEFHLRRLGARLRLVEAPTVRDVVQRHVPALIFVRRTSDGDLAELGLADRRRVGSFRSRPGEPVETQVFTIGLSPACS
jgi:4-amino-4-deoxy-L-arabinose transferase-like glycosyltransferase